MSVVTSADVSVKTLAARMGLARSSLGLKLQGERLFKLGEVRSLLRELNRCLATLGKDLVTFEEIEFPEEAVAARRRATPRKPTPPRRAPRSAGARPAPRQGNAANRTRSRR